jgi:signal transduction histidine kinase
LIPKPGTQAGQYGITPDDLMQRQAQQEAIRKILQRNRLVQSRKPTSSPAVETVKHLADKRADLDKPLSRDSKTMRTEARELSSLAPLPATSEDKDSPKRLRETDAAIVSAVPAEQIQGQAAFDLLNKPSGRWMPEKKLKATGKLGRIEDLELDYSYQKNKSSANEQQRKKEKTKVSSAKVFAKKMARKETGTLPEVSTKKFDVSSPAMAPGPYSIKTQEEAEDAISDSIRIDTFVSEIDPLEFALLDSGHFVLFRKVWKQGKRYIQGMLIEQNLFLKILIEKAFHDTALSDMSKLIVAHQGNVFTAFGSTVSRDYLSSAKELQGEVLYQTHLSDPFGDLELIFSVTRLPAGPGAALIAWLALILSAVLFGGFFLMYRLASKQIELAHQQQDFVSAVSHELKTPLTSIRMYGEMLREGWAAEDKKQGYYEYIHDESERLSRLISNVLQLARLTRNELELDLKLVPVSELIDCIRSRLASQVERAGYKLNLVADEESGIVAALVDSDSFIQVIINLVDNAIKFSASAEQKTIDIECRALANDRVQFTVRDYGPGVAENQMKKIFKLFYRSGNELTRETVGTGIGLALVNQLVQAMGGTVDVVNRKPGVEFQVFLQSQRDE